MKNILFFIKRLLNFGGKDLTARSSTNFTLLAALMDNGKFLLAARRFRHGAHTEYLISYDYDDLYPGSSSYVGKLR